MAGILCSPAVSMLDLAWVSKPGRSRLLMAAFLVGGADFQRQENPVRAFLVSFPWKQIELRAGRERRENSLE